jgi:hypothetical protein
MLINNLAKLSHSSRNAVSISLIVIAALGMYKLIVAPHANYLFAAQRYGFVVDDVVKENKVIDNKVKIKKKKLQELQEQHVELQNTLFTPDKAREFFSDLQVISEETGCIVYSLNLLNSKKNTKNRQPKQTAGVVTQSALLSVVGVYKDIPKLIQRLQARTQKVWVDSVKIQTLDGSSSQARCDITITICAIENEETSL